MRIWIKYLIDRLNTNERSSNESTSNIQRIAKKSRTSSSTNFLNGKLRNTAPLPVYPLIFNPFIRPTIYSTYIPFSHVATHSFPLSHVPYQQEEYHHQILIPIQTQYPYFNNVFSNVPGYMSSTPVNMNTNVQNPVNVHPYIPPNDQGEIRKYDKHEGPPTIITKHDINSTTPMGLPQEEPVQINPTVDEEYKPLNSSKEQSVIDVNNLPNPEIIQNDRNKKFQDSQYLISSTTADEIGTTTAPDTTTFQENYHTTLMPMGKADESNQIKSNQPEKVIGETTQNIPQKNSYFIADKANDVNESFSKSSTHKINAWPITEKPKETMTGSEREAEITNYSNTKGTSITEEKIRPVDPQKVPVGDRVSNDKNTTTNYFEASTTRTNEKSVETIKTEEPKTVSESSTYADVNTTVYPTTLCEDNDCQTSKSSFDATESIKTTVQNVSNDSSIQSRSEFSTTPSTRANYENYTQTVINSSTVFQISTTKVSDATTSTKEISKFPTFETSTTKLSTFVFDKNSPNKNDVIQSTSLSYNTPIPTIQPLNYNNTITLLVSKSTTIPTPLITKNSGDNIDIEDNKDVVINHKKSTILPKTTVSTPLRRESIKNTLQDSKLPSGKPITNKFSSSRTTSEVPNNMYNREDKMNHNFSVTAKDTKKIWSTSKPTTVKTFISNRKPVPLVTVSDSSKRKSLNNQDRMIASTESTQKYDDSQLWYNNHMNVQNIPKKELSEEQIDFLIKKLIKLLKPEIEKQTLTKSSIERLIAPKLGDQDKLVYIIFPWVRDAFKNMGNEETTEVNRSRLKYSE